jgi:hypothetical protein
MSTLYLVQWNRTGKTWHVDITGVGRYSVHRPPPSKKWYAYLNDVRIAGIDGEFDAEQVKKTTEERIVAAKISGEVLKENNHCAEVTDAAMRGVLEYTKSMRGCAALGALTHVTKTKKGFVLVFGNDNRVYFDVTEM